MVPRDSPCDIRASRTTFPNLPTLPLAFPIVPRGIELEEVVDYQPAVLELIQEPQLDQPGDRQAHLAQRCTSHHSICLPPRAVEQHSHPAPTLELGQLDQLGIRVKAVVES